MTGFAHGTVLGIADKIISAVKNGDIKHFLLVGGCEVNELPLSIILSWYEQKAVCVLLTLLSLGIKNIKLGPTLPAFVSPNVLNYLVDHFNLGPTTTVDADLKAIR